MLSKTGCPAGAFAKDSPSIPRLDCRNTAVRPSWRGPAIRKITTASAITPRAIAGAQAGHGRKNSSRQRGWGAARRFGDTLRTAFTYAYILDYQSCQDRLLKMEAYVKARLASGS